MSRQMLLELPVGLSCLTALTALQLHHNSLSTLHTELASLTRLQRVDASHNWLSGAKGCLPQLLAAWPHLAVLELDNVSDKRGALTLPPELAECRWAIIWHLTSKRRAIVVLVGASQQSHCPVGLRMYVLATIMLADVMCQCKQGHCLVCC